jgi:putative tryptophan/tyrosine transport system substrate-binding protein
VSRRGTFDSEAPLGSVSEKIRDNLIQNALRGMHSAGGTAHQVRVGHQREGREGAGHDDSASANSVRRRVDAMKGAHLGARILFALGLFICASCSLAAPVAIGFIAPDEEPRYTNLLSGLRQGLQAAGVGAESTIIAEHRISRGDSAGALRAAESLRAGNARLAFVVGSELTKLVRSVTKELPIIFITPGDPVRTGLAASLARPGSNVTGMTFEFPELSAKRLELLKEIAPTARRVGIVYDSRDSSPRQGFAAAKEVAARLGMQLVEIDVESLNRSASASVQTGKLDGLILIPGGAISTVIESAVKIAAAQRIVSVAWTRNEATRDTILSYGATDIDVARSAARLVVRVLNGQPAGDMPIEQPTKFEFVINLKAAKALGITIPQALLLRADEVIQ